MMYFNFLEDHIIDWQLEEEDHVNWRNASSQFIRSSVPSAAEISKQEKRLKAQGYNFPEELKMFWSEIGCGYLCPNDSVDNGLEEPATILDIYFREGEWSDVKFACDIIDKNELAFFRTCDLSYLTIGLEEGINLGKVYYCGDEIATNLIDFTKRILLNPIYYLTV